MFRPPFGTFWDSGLWTWLTGDSLSKPMHQPDRGYSPDQLSRDQRSKIFRCDVKQVPGAQAFVPDFRCSFSRCCKLNCYS